MESIIDQIEVNYWAVVAAGAVSFVIGAIWYTALATPWQKAVGLTTKELQKFNKLAYPVTFVAELLIAYVLAHVVFLAEVDSVMDGVSTGLWMWLGFVVPVLAINVLYQLRPFKLFAIDAAHYLLVFLASGAVLGAWLP